MYKIFINEKPFVIATTRPDHPRFAGCRVVEYKPGSLGSLIRECETMSSRGIIVTDPDPDLVFKDFYTHFVAIEAAGGVVFNSKAELLLIRRLGKWDLPKGKIDAGENSDEAAIREVTEECSITGLQIEQRLTDTFHTYKMHNHRFLKTTHWYLMHTESTATPVPQTEEHITEAAWFNWKSLRADSLDTYLSIRELFIDLAEIKPRTARKT
jgi:8-oxo-dGTP pyrophosphatase MutT (NUDIX family)